jgi:hypothetical protein
MSKITAKNATVLINGYHLSTYAMSYEAESSVDPVDATGFRDGSKNFVPGLSTAKISADMMWDLEVGKVHTALGALGTGLVTIIPETYVIGTPSISMPYMQATYTPQGETSSLLKIGNVSLESYGNNNGIEYGKTLFSGIVTDEFDGTAVDNAAGTSVKYSAILHVYLPAATDTYEIKVQDSSNNSTWTDLCTFTADGSTLGAERKVGTAVKRYRRITTTRTGTDDDNFGFTVVLYTI